MGRRLYIGNLPYASGEEDLRELFQCPDRYGDRSSPGVRLRRNDGRGRRGQGDHGAQPDRVSGPPTDGQRGSPKAPRPAQDPGFDGGRREPRW